MLPVLKKYLSIREQYYIKFKYLFFFTPFLVVISTNVILLIIFLIKDGSGNFLKIIFAPAALFTILTIFFILLALEKFKTSRYYTIFKKIKHEKDIIFSVITFFVFGSGLILHLFAYPQSWLAKTLASNNFLFYELNILQKIFSLYVFYVLMILLVYAVGRKILSLFKINFNSKLELFIFSAGTGFIPFMLGTFLIAVLGWLYAWVIWVFILFSLIFSWKELKKILKELSESSLKLSFENRFSSFKSLAVVGLFFLLSVNFIIITKPLPFDSDSMHTYFNAPNLYVNCHKYTPLRHIAHGSMGQNGEMVYAAIMSILNPRFIIHLPLLYFILSLLGFYLLLKKLFNEKHAALGLLAIYFMPMNYFFVMTSKVDTLLIFYSLLMLYSLFLWQKNNFDNKLLYLLGIFSGIAFGVKYNAALLIIPLYAAIPIITILNKKELTRVVKPLIISILLAILSFSPWAIKNQIYFNNIFHPYTYFNLKDKNTDNFNTDAKYKTYQEERIREVTFLKHSLSKDELSILGFMQKIWNQSVGRKTVPALSHNFGFAALLIIPFYFLLGNKKIILLSLIPLSYFIIWYALGIGGPWYALFGFIMLYALFPHLLLKSKKLLYLYLPFISIITLSSFLIFTHNINYLMGKENIEEYAANSIVHYKTAQYINNLNLSADEKIIIAGDFKAAYINRNDQIIEYIDPYLQKTGYLLNKGEENFYQYLKDSSIKYIIHSKLYLFYNSWVKYKGITLDEYLTNYKGEIPSLYQDMENLKNFLAHHTRQIYSDGYYTLYEINK
jgi:hypothetical protein